MSAHVPAAELETFEALVQRALRTGDDSPLPVLGYGEAATVLSMVSSAGTFTCKRILPFAHAEQAELCANLIRSYIETLVERGLEVVDTDIRQVPGPSDTVVVYCIQPSLPGAMLAPAHFRTLTEAQAADTFVVLLDLLRTSVDATAAPDGRLSSWAFAGSDRAIYLAVGSPLLRRGGRDWAASVLLPRALPGPLYPILRTLPSMRMRERRFTLRGQVLDLLVSLRRERLHHLTPAFVEIANRRLELAKPVTLQQVKVHALHDARSRTILHKARHVDRWLYAKLRRKPYPYLIPPWPRPSA